MLFFKSLSTDMIENEEINLFTPLNHLLLTLIFSIKPLSVNTNDNRKVEDRSLVQDSAFNKLQVYILCTI
jgi:hypothetical protein